ncbi:MAG: 3-carboxymuconate cyclase [Alphaproteobacteria bacterium]|nr:3-carboxymuconate cyclase [Alphaproteobacteria bacterium]
MLDRRQLTGLLGAAALPAPAWAASALFFYASVGPRLTTYELDMALAVLTPQGAVTLPANVQYAWPDPLRRFLYVVASNNKPGGLDPDAGGHFAQVFRIGGDGTLTAHGPAVPLQYRPIHATVDPGGRFLLIAYNLPSSMTVHRIQADGSIGTQVPQAAALDTGIYAHQIRVSPSGRTVALVTRGNDPRSGHAEDPGALKIFAFENGQLSNLQSLAPHGQGLGFGPRHLDFGGRFAFISLERENSICVYGLAPDGRLSAEPLFIREALIDPDAKSKYPGQTAGPIHVHPNGRFVYQTNRGSGTLDYNGQQVSNGGENDIAVWRIDPATGEPTRIQNIDSHGFEIRTFSITPDGSMLIAAAQNRLLVRDGETVKPVSAGFSFYRIGADGKLTFLRKQDIETSAGTLFWSGLLTMP